MKKKLSLVIISMVLIALSCNNKKQQFTYELVKAKVYGHDTLLKIFTRGNQDSIVEYFSEDTVRVITMYKNKKKNGSERTYYPNGKLDGIFNYKNDLKDGPFETFYDSGVKRSKGTYVNGVVVGPVYGWDNNGNLISK